MTNAAGDVPHPIDGDPPPDRGERTWRRWVGAALALLATSYLGWLVYQQREMVGEALAQVSLGSTCVGLVFASLVVTLRGLYHEKLLARLSGDHGAGALVFRAFCRSQIVRYLPGKIWGVVYEAAQLAPRFPGRSVLVANALQMLNVSLLSFGIIASAITAMLLGETWPLLGVVVAVALMELLHRSPLLEKRLMALAQRWRRVPLVDPPVEPTAAPIIGTAILLGEWAAYFAVWLMLVPGDAHLALQLGTWYASASLLALFALAVPGGIAVREALFVYLATHSGADTAHLVVLGVLLRVILTVGELMAVAFAEIRARHATH